MPQDLKVVATFREHEWSAALGERRGHIPHDHGIAFSVQCELCAERRNGDTTRTLGRVNTNGGFTQDHAMGDAAPERVRLRIDTVPDRAALHEDDRLMIHLSDRFGSRRSRVQIPAPRFGKAL
jgi:hypothetical protein